MLKGFSKLYIIYQYLCNCLLYAGDIKLFIQVFVQWGIKGKEKKRYDWVRDDQKKGWTKHNIEPPIEYPLIKFEEDLVEVLESSKTFGKYGLQLENLVEMDEESLFREIESSEHMTP